MESSLSVPYTELCAEVGDFLGRGRGANYAEKAWTPKDILDIEKCVKGGYDKFIKPPILPGERAAYIWSFISNPVTDLTLASGEQYVTLPDDFGGSEKNITIADGTRRVVEITGPGIIQASYARNATMTGSPLLAALIHKKETSSVGSQKSQLWVYPIADANYALKWPYFFLPDALSMPRPYPVGGAMHAQTVLCACLAEAEFRRDDARGVCYANFMERLATSISLDRAKKSQFLGKNRDNSDAKRGRDYTNHDMQMSVGTYNGVAYD